MYKLFVNNVFKFIQKTKNFPKKLIKCTFNWNNLANQSWTPIMFYRDYAINYMETNYNHQTIEKQK